jgi:hypothetical protein
MLIPVAIAPNRGVSDVVLKECPGGFSDRPAASGSVKRFRTRSTPLTPPPYLDEFGNSVCRLRS